MKTNPNLVRWGLVALLGAMLVVFTQCIGGSGSTIDEGVHVQPAEVLAPEDEEAPEVGVKDAERILQTMSALTGVPTSNVQNIFNSDLKAQLPTSSRVEAMLETHMMGAAKLAGEYCQALIENDALRRAIWGNFDFAATNTTAALTDPTSRQFFVDTMLNRFWGEGVYEPAEYEEGAMALEELILDIMDGQTQNGATKRNAAKAACIAALSSAQVILQ